MDDGARLLKRTPSRRSMRFAEKACAEPRTIGEAIARLKLTWCATCSTMINVKAAGIREARQNLSALLAEVRKGREVVITDRGRPVAHLVPPRRQSAVPFSSHRRFRARIRLKGRPLSDTVAEERGDRV